MSTDKAMVTDEMVKAVAWSASSQPGQPFGMILTDDDIRNILTIGMANGPTALSHGAEAVEPDACPTCGGTGKEGRHSICRDCDEGAEAVEPEQKPVGEVCDMPGTRGFTMAAFKVEDVPVGTKLYASPVRSAQEAVSDLDIQIAYEAWIDRTIGARAPITAFYAGYRAALLPRGGEAAYEGARVALMGGAGE